MRQTSPQIQIMTESKDRILSDIDVLTRRAQIDALFQRAIYLHQQGQDDEAENLAQQVLDEQPEHAEANHLLGHIAAQHGQYRRACQFIASAIRLDPNQPSYWFHYGIALHREGRNEEALAAFKRFTEINPGYPEAYYYQGIVLSDLGLPEEALTCLDLAIQIRPDYAEAHNNRAFLLRVLGRLQEALTACERAILLRPDAAEPFLNKANTLLDMGLVEQALIDCKQALRLNPLSPEINNTHGSILKRLGRLESALAAYREAIRIKPDFVQAILNYGNTLSTLGKLDDARIAYENAIRINHESAEAYSNIGNIYLAQGKHADALECYQKALDIDPNLADAHNNLGSLYLELFKNALARTCFEKALESKPDLAEAHFNLGDTLQRYGDTTAAIMSFRKALELKPSFTAARWGALLSLPVLNDSEEQIEQERTRWICGVKELLDTMDLGDTEAIAAAKTAATTYTNFYLNYQNHIDLEEQILYGKLLYRIARSAYPQYSDHRSQQMRYTKEKIRVGFVSSFFFWHSIFKTHGHWITKLNKKDFHVSAFYDGFKQDHATREIISRADYFTINRNIDELISSIAAQNLDVLIYTDLGMAARQQLAAALRLAPVQCNGGGHPVTSGLPTMDYFLGSDLMEPVAGDSHYSETLVRLPNLASSYPFPEIEKAQIPPSAIRSGDELVYLNLQSLFKLLPQHDDIYPRIAMQVSHSRFWFIGGNPESITEHFQNRLRKAFSAHGMDADMFCTVHPQMPQLQFFGLVKAADIILDGISWSGNNSSLEALAFDKPIVTIPGASFRSRHCYGILKRIGVTETIADTLDNYIEIAAKLGNDPSFRTELVEKIANRKYLAYEDNSVISSLEEFLKSSVNNNS